MARAEDATEAHRSLWRDALERFARNPVSLLALLLVVLLLVAAVAGPRLTPYDPLRQNLQAVSQPPSAAHWLGTDEVGRDLLSRILAGARTAFVVGLLVTALTTILGVLFGATAAYFGGWVDGLIMRLTDVLMSFPSLLLAIFVNASVKPPIADAATRFAQWSTWKWLDNGVMIDYLVVFGALAAIGWPGKARLIRGQILSLREREFVEAARAIGAGNWSIITQHLIPNSLGPLIVAATIGFGGAMLSESSLSYLGIGIQPPGASWGAMISENQRSWRAKPHLVAVPGATLALCIFAFNFLGDGLNDALNPRQRRR
jgi:peptide/nickel transport system permease protein